MLEDFVKWMASLPEFEREQKMEVLMSLFHQVHLTKILKDLKVRYEIE